MDEAFLAGVVSAGTGAVVCAIESAPLGPPGMIFGAVVGAFAGKVTAAGALAGTVTVTLAAKVDT